MKTIKTITLICLIILSSCSTRECDCPQCPAQVDKEAAEAEIQELIDLMEQSIMTQDKEAFMSYYGEGIISLPPGKPADEGLQVIREGLDEVWSEPIPQGMTFNMERTDIWILGDHAVETGTFSYNMDGMEEPSEGKWLNFYEKQNGKYKVIRDIWNSNSIPDMTSQEDEVDE